MRQREAALGGGNIETERDISDNKL